MKEATLIERILIALEEALARAWDAYYRRHPERNEPFDVTQEYGVSVEPTREPGVFTVTVRDNAVHLPRCGKDLH